MINDINEVETMKKRDKWRKREIERKKHGQSEICNICLTLPLSIFVWRTDHFGLGKNRCEVPPFRLSFGWLLDAASNRHNLKLKSHQTPCSPFDISNSSFSIDTLQFCEFFFYFFHFISVMVILFIWCAESVAIDHHIGLWCCRCVLCQSLLKLPTGWYISSRHTII